MNRRTFEYWERAISVQSGKTQTTMGAEIEWLGECEPDTDPRPRCRYCARILSATALSPAEMEPHCSARGCRVCAECSAGGCPVAPGYRGSTGAVDYASKRTRFR